MSATLLAQADLDDAFKTPRLGSGGSDGDDEGLWWSGGGDSPARVSGMSPNANVATEAGTARDQRSASLSSGAGPDPDSSYESVGSVKDTPKPSFGFRF